MLAKSCRATWPLLLASALATLGGCGGTAFETPAVAQGSGGASQPDAAASGGSAGVAGSVDASADADPCPAVSDTCAGKY